MASGSTTVQQVFGVSTNLNAVVNVNAAAGSQRQLFVNNENGVTGLIAPSSVVVAVSGLNEYVVVGSATNNSISVFQLNSTTGDLTFLKSYDHTVVGSNFLNSMSYDASTGDLTLVGSAGVETIAVNSNGTLGAVTVLTNVGAETASATQGNATFYVNPATNTLTGVFNNNGTIETVSVAASAGNSNGLIGASAVAISPDGLYVYVASQSGGTLAIFSIVTTGSGSTATHSLDNIQTLQNGDAFGTHGLEGTVSLAVTADDQYVLALNGSGDSIAVFQRQTAAQPSKNIVVGDLLFGQQVHEDVGGILGLDAPTSMVLGPEYTNSTTGQPQENLWIGSVGASTDLGGLGLFIIDLSPQTPPATQITKYSNMSALTLEVGNGDDNIALNDPPPSLVATTTIITGSGQDQVVVNNYGGATAIYLGSGADTVDVRVTADMTGTANTLTINGGTGADTIDIASTGIGATTTFLGNRNATAGDSIVIESTDDNAVTTIVGSDLADTVRVQLANLSASATTTTWTVRMPAFLPGDTLILDPQDPSINPCHHRRPGNRRHGPARRQGHRVLQALRKAGSPDLAARHLQFADLQRHRRPVADVDGNGDRERLGRDAFRSVAVRHRRQRQFRRRHRGGDCEFRNRRVYGDGYDFLEPIARSRPQRRRHLSHRRQGDQRRRLVGDR